MSEARLREILAAGGPAAEYAREYLEWGDDAQEVAQQWAEEDDEAARPERFSGAEQDEVETLIGALDERTRATVLADVRRTENPIPGAP